MLNAFSVSFERLCGRENFDVWKSQSKSDLIIKGHWKMVQNGLPVSTRDADRDANCKGTSCNHIIGGAK